MDLGWKNNMSTGLFRICLVEFKQYQNDFDLWQNITSTLGGDKKLLLWKIGPQTIQKREEFGSQLNEVEKAKLGDTFIDENEQFNVRLKVYASPFR